MRPRRLRLPARRVDTITIRGRMSTAIRRVRIMAGEPGLLSGAHVRLRVPRLVRPHVRLRVLRLVRLAAVAGTAVEVAADAGEV